MEKETQHEVIKKAKKEYREKQFFAIKQATGLLKELAWLCVDIAKSYPDLQVRTMGKSLKWLDFDRIKLAEYEADDMQIQCMGCENFMPGGVNNDSICAIVCNYQEKVSPSLPIACQNCWDNFNDNNSQLRWCSSCNLYEIDKFSENFQASIFAVEPKTCNVSTSGYHTFRKIDLFDNQINHESDYEYDYDAIG